MRSFGIFGEISGKNDSDALSIRDRIRAHTLQTTSVIRTQATHFAPALISIGLIGVLALSRLSAVGPAAPVASLSAARSEVVLDEIASTDVAAAVASMTDMIVADEVVAQAETLATQSDLTNATENQLAKPQLVATETKTTEDILKHTVADGENLDAIAAHYGVTTDTIKWANGLRNNTVAAGTELTIPPVNGVLHTVNAGETPELLAQQFGSDPARIRSFNDAEVTGLVPGTQIVIPDGSRPAPAAARARTYRDLGANIGRYATYYSNDFSVIGGRVGDGQCVAYVKYRAPQLGNDVSGISGSAYRWARYANSGPRVGAVGQRNNHVVVIEAVSEDGSMVKYSDQNGIGGRGRVIMTNDWVPASGFRYIYN